MPVKSETEQRIKDALIGRTSPLDGATKTLVQVEAGCSIATLHRSEAFKAFQFPPSTAATAKPARVTAETMAKLRGTISTLANCVQVLALRVEAQDRELAELRQRANQNVLAFRTAVKG